MKKDIKKLDLVQTTSWFMLALISAYMIMSAMYGSAFAKIHVEIPKLNLPFFIGEWLFGVALIIFIFLFTKENRQKAKRYKAFGIVALYILFMVIFTSGKWFGLSLRNAAMFYYLFFAMFTYQTLKSIQFNSKILIIAIMAMIISCQMISLDSYFRYSFIVLAIVGILKLPKGATKIILAIFLALAAHPDYLFLGSRTNLISSILSLIFVLVFGVLYWLPHSKRWKAGIIIGGFILIMTVAWIRADRNGVTSLITPQVQINKLDQWDQMVNESHYVPSKLNAKMYSPKGFLSMEGTQRMDQGEDAPGIPEVKKPVVVSPELIRTEPPSYVIRSNAQITDNEKNFRPLSVAYGNTAFRLFIWQDMLEELWTKQAWFGFGFGYPQRSKRIETLNWAASEWQRDGWITPHNFFLHLIYRAGIIGLLFLIVLIAHVVKMTRTSIRKKSLEGLLLVSALVYWLVAAEFLVVLEVPYYSIPFWALYGLTWFFTDRLRAKRV